MKIDLELKSDYIAKYEEGYPLLLKEALVDFNKVTQEGMLLNLFGANKKFIAKAYYGNQNKGFGWILSYDKNEKIDLRFFSKKIKSAITYRKEFYDDATTTAFRVFNGEGDGVGGLSIDYYDGYYLLTWYSAGIYTFKEEILEALKSCVKYKGIYEKKRFDTKGMYLSDDDDFLLGKRVTHPLIIKENGVNFTVYLDDGAMVGVFLDQRDVRKTLKEKYAKSARVLNTFSYTGAFSVAAALGGALSTTSVDLAKRSLPKTSEQFEVNNINLDSQEIIVEDVFKYFKYAVRKKLTFDMVILDPPSFARSKKHTFSASKDYVSLLKEAIQITKKNGIILASTNSANFSMMTFRDFIYRAFKDSKVTYEVLESFTLPKDFRVLESFKEGNYLKVVFIKKKERIWKK